ncbi:hypothetical protein POM88_006021 [Heracleum sosnowskyi]|uniref:Uncharacterized protein n=1 Tax=Heracleum sosnowskyi TaxID=360622 RepID=A0AAD8J319_9APIA|nr:hypothetical protein POM88_006021 [Heracleum sosnowskyi]
MVTTRSMSGATNKIQKDGFKAKLVAPRIRESEAFSVFMMKDYLKRYYATHPRTTNGIVTSSSSYSPQLFIDILLQTSYVKYDSNKGLRCKGPPGLPSLLGGDSELSVATSSYCNFSSKLFTGLGEAAATAGAEGKCHLGWGVHLWSKFHLENWRYVAFNVEFPVGICMVPDSQCHLQRLRCHLLGLESHTIAGSSSAQYTDSSK